MKGRKPKPRKLKLIEGNPGKRPIKKPSISETDDHVTMPRFLGAEAKKLWKELAPELKKRGLLTALDRAAFSGLCASYGHMVEMERIIQKEGSTIVDNRGVTRKHPAVTILNQFFSLFKSFSEMFGLSPLARERISIPEPQKMSFRELLKSRREAELDNEESDP